MTQITVWLRRHIDEKTGYPAWLFNHFEYGENKVWPASDIPAQRAMWKNQHWRWRPAWLTDDKPPRIVYDETAPAPPLD